MTNRRRGNRAGRGGSTANNKGKDYHKNLNLVKAPPELPPINKSNVILPQQLKEEEEILNKEKIEQLKELRRFLKTKDLELKEIPKDGACLFRAISEQILYTQEKHPYVRKECVKYLHDNEEIFSPFICTEDGADYATYLFELSQPNTWGGQLELQALSLMYKTNFMIYSSQITKNPLYIENLKKEEADFISEEENRKYIVDISSFTIENGFDRTLMLLYSNGNHYDCLYSLPYFEVFQICQSLLYETIFQSIAISTDKELDNEDMKMINEFQNVGIKVWKKSSTEQTKNDLSLAKELNLSPYLVPLKNDDLEGEFQTVKGKNKKKRNKKQNVKIGIEIDVNLKPRDGLPSEPKKSEDNQNKPKPKILIEAEGDPQFPTLFGSKSKPNPAPEEIVSSTDSITESTPSPPKWGAKKDWGALLSPEEKKQPPPTESAERPSEEQ